METKIQFVATLSTSMLDRYFVDSVVKNITFAPLPPPSPRMGVSAKEEKQNKLIVIRNGIGLTNVKDDKHQ